MKVDYDVVIIGGGPAGLSAALTLGRMSRSVLLCDDQRPRNAPAEHMNHFPSQDGVAPAVWRERARRDLEKYRTVQLRNVSVRRAKREGAFFAVELSPGEMVTARKLILAYGVEDQLPVIPGFRELWGKAIFHCPFCHGFEAKGSKLGLIANGRVTDHLLPMIASLSADFMLFTNDDTPLSDELSASLARRGIQAIGGEVSSFVHEGEKLKAVKMKDGKIFEREALFYVFPMPYKLKSQVGELLGCEKNDFGFYKLSELNRTSVAGVFAAGDIMTGQHSVLTAAASGQTAGAGAAFDLATEDFRNI